MRAWKKFATVGLALIAFCTAASAQQNLAPGNYSMQPGQYNFTVVGNTPPPVAVTVTALGIAPTAVIGPATASATVTLSGPAPTGGVVVALSSSNAAAQVSSNLVVSAGASTATFGVTTSAVVASVSANITASLNGASAMAVLTVNPPPPPVNNVVNLAPGSVTRDPVIKANTTYQTTGCVDSGVRAGLSDVPNFAVIEATGPIVPGANAKLQCLVIRPAAGVFIYTLIEMSPATWGGNSVNGVQIIRSVVLGDPVMGGRRGIANGDNVVVRDSYIAGFFDKQGNPVSGGGDSQCIAFYDNDGPMTVTNNTLFNCASENIMLGGSDPTKTGRIPSHLEFSGNLVQKAMAGEPGYYGVGYNVKNLFELKNASYVHAANNTFIGDYAPGDGQNGIPILFTVRNQDGNCPWCVVQHVVFENNVVDNAGGGVNFLGSDDIHPSAIANDIIVRNNKFHRISWNLGDGRLFQIIAGPPCSQTGLPAGWSNPPWICTGAMTGLQIIGNTDDSPQTHNSVISMDGGPTPGVVFTGNDVTDGQYGLVASGITGSAMVPMWLPGATFSGNHFRGAALVGDCPAGNTCTSQ